VPAFLKVFLPLGVEALDFFGVATFLRFEIALLGLALFFDFCHLFVPPETETTSHILLSKPRFFAPNFSAWAQYPIF
jgi:hypothetical protein